VELLEVRHMLRMAVFAGALAGCTAYQPSSFTRPGGPAAGFVGQRATVGCLDIAVDRRADYVGSAVLQYQLGNRCNRAVEVDLQQVPVIGRFADGDEVTLAPFDPDLEIRPVKLAGRLVGAEAIAYRTPRPASQVCVDVARIERPAGARAFAAAPPAHWLCFAARVPLDELETADPVADAPAPADPVADAPAPADPEVVP
jgi:hypothetical protein